ncbi:type I polyketide synthase [Streptomyces turgidiscabies]|uniref:Putative [acyl-carrier-protein] S-malonyltransferase n=4 Tax=Streptomyces TaxID=1883 RepID=L7F5Z2_STRT8|nr:type I polyketide synthase [Streptomyces turgidiscabies]ELP66539.1 putative [acyl-carrier-protein] S-malonyltransferase [Streptomyces turgidiscabies Car8]MDX3494805.1 type I polyketide synthase [Streptomyces turgidiscabies]BAP59926.1 putative polyketide synthase [Streptomyces turgidiscabies]GAQ71414.1 phenolphthiocerol synthesis polyketide synthase type I Pks15/1 [Streptomyces turgidiscabies]
MTASTASTASSGLTNPDPAGPARPDRPLHVPIAVIGTAALTPGAADAEGFWRNVLTGRDLITDVPADHWLVEDYYDPDPSAPDRTYARRGAFLPVTDFDPSAYGIPPNALPATDTTQLLALAVAERVLADAGSSGAERFDGERTGVILGTAALELLHTMSNRMQRPVWLKSLRESGIPEERAQEICDRIAGHYVPWQEESFPGVLSNVVAGRIASRFDLHGSNYTTDAACGSSLAAVTAAANELAVGTADLMITGGVDTLNDILMYMCFSKTPALSRSGDCRPFSDAADGTMLGEALVMFALKRLDDAERDGDRIHAVLRGIGSSSDGRGSAIYTPVPAGQARALRRAYASAGYGPESVELVEAHGTGTTAGDAAEFTALRTVFEESGRRDGQWCALGSVKSQIGHTKSAAGAAGLLKAVMALRHKVLPPTIKVERPNPALELDKSPLYLNTEARPWVKEAAQPRRASVSSFGFGGTNFHLTLEEYVPAAGARSRPVPPARTVPTELVVLGAASAEELLTRAAELATEVTDGTWAGATSAAQRGFRPSDPYRLAMTATGPEDLAKRLEQLGTLIRRDPDRPLTTPDGVTYRTGTPTPGRTAFLFSGQGSQYTGMGADLAMHFPAAREAWDRAAEHELDAELPLHRVVFPVPAFTEESRAAQQDLLTRTEWAQPALAVQSAALLAVLRAAGVEPDCVAGHSFGELVALHAAGVLDERVLLRLARRRGELMRDAATEPGAMLAVMGVSREDVATLTDGFEDAVWAANENAPGQVVLSGRADAVDRLERRLGARGVAVRRLRASGAFHTPLMADAVGPFTEFLDDLDLRAPKFDVYGNADARPYPEDPALIRERIAGHLLSPVRFVAGVEAMYESGVRTFVEVGAGSTLTGLTGEILDGREHLALSLDRRGVHGVTALQQALGTLAVSGVAVDLDALWSVGDATDAREEEGRGAHPQAPAQLAPLPRPRMAVPISGANHGALYPPPGGAQALPRPVPAATTAAARVEAAPEAGITPTPSVGAAAADPWLAAFQETQRQAAEAHAEFQRTMAESHMHFLRTLETPSLGAPVGTPLPNPTPLVPPAPQLPLPTETFTSPTSPQTEAAAAPTPTTKPETTPAAPGPDVGALLLEVVAEKTGFPVDILELHMELETDLGIDSIKRVQILSVLRDRVPALARVDAHELAPLRTLQQITDKLREAESGAAPVALPASPPPPVRPIDEETPLPTQLARAVSVMVAAPLPGMELAGLRDGPVLVTDEGTGVARRLVDRLGEHGVRAAVVTEAVLADAADVADAEGGGVVLLSGLRPVSSAEAATSVNRDAFGAARSVARQLVARGRVFVTVQDTGGDFGLGGGQGERAWLGGPAGLARTAAKEWPDAGVKAVDCERGDRDADALAEVLATELLRGGSAGDIGLRADGTRWALRDRIEPAGPAEAAGEHTGPLGPDAVIVATGGARGVTAVTLRALAEAHLPSIVLLGRTELTEEPAGLADATDERQLKGLLAGQARRQGGTIPSPAELTAEAARVLAVREIRATLDAIEASGSRVRYLSVDTRDARALHRALDTAREEFGPISGIVHGAGVLADSRLADKTDAQFTDVFDTKVEGLRALLAATADDPLDLVCVFSSVAGRFGNTGQADYAMANEILAQVASTVAVNRPNCLVKSIAWGPWDGGMVGPELREHFREQGVPLIPTDAGARALLRELSDVPDPARVRVTLTAGDADASASLGAPPAQAVGGDIEIGLGSHPYLADHSVAATPVVPMALVMEWFLGAARAWRPDAPGFVLRDLEVLSRIGLDGPGTAPEQGRRLRVRSLAAPADDPATSRLVLELTSGASSPHYRAAVEVLTEADRPLTGSVRYDARDLGSPPDQEIYDGHVLFHGPAFHAITALEGVSGTGAAALVRGVRELDWPGAGWHTDPAAIDGGLQLALKWAEYAHDGAFLPMGAVEVRTTGRGPVGEGARCVVLARGAARDLDVSCDVALLEPDGSVHTELLGVTLVRRPDTGKVSPGRASAPDSASDAQQVAAASRAASASGGDRSVHTLPAPAGTPGRR